MVLEGKSVKQGKSGELFVIALLQWPVVVLLFELPNTVFWLVIKSIGVAWLLITGLIPFKSTLAGMRKAGVSLIVCNFMVALFWFFHPDRWQYLFLFLIFIGFYNSVRAVENEDGFSGSDR